MSQPPDEILAAFQIWMSDQSAITKTETLLSLTEAAFSAGYSAAALMRSINSPALPVLVSGVYRATPLTKAQEVFGVHCYTDPSHTANYVLIDFGVTLCDRCLDALEAVEKNAKTPRLLIKSERAETESGRP